ncbi:MAG: prephenate dehydrogenase/arogenate dehydrogenase family protein [Desulfobacteraceae bacterium]|nr:MAG: prephenate dehydrogenase/arogenate dehydrogenase family protein [Desulfobacteraceae bacterium]
MSKGITIGIIGGTGSMGKWFRDFFSDAGHNVLVSGRKTETTYTDIIKECDAVILSVPLDAAIEISGQIGPLLRKNQLLMDLCSLKEAVVKNMLDNTEADVIGTHPLFGPFTDSIKGQNVIFCRGRGEYWLKWLEDEYTSKGAVVNLMDPTVHDRHMAIVQGLTHFLAICMGRTLQKMNINNSTALSCSTPVFKINYDLIGRLFAQDLGLYQNLISKNIHFSDVLDQFLSVVEEGRDSLLSGQDEKGLLFLEGVRDYFKDSCRNSLKESNKLISALYGEQ